ncbi:MAG: hypothetical protein M5R36_10540 [Deltaproteobacteria bacterium]|nr:hypothetical protein [Deltaproteobacteria bacterium]
MFDRMLASFRPTVLVLDYESGGNIQAFPIGPKEERAEMHGRVLTRVLRTGDFAVFRIEDAAP